jgi:hypothetical protein
MTLDMYEMDLLETPTAAAERRRSPRHTVAANAWLSPEAGSCGPNHHIVVSDLSLHGIGFSADEKLEPEAVHWMVLDSGNLRVSSRIRVASCRPDANGVFECGAEFF